ncbi:hypothetical protein BDY24DRAFT_381288 [Mrakia frigida]|uniref:zinc finger MYND domain-containing protein n=1 Tax=Mrakia frigida TaxID=29902 RepID=UPI003FCC2657
MVSTVSSPASQLAYPTAVELAVAFSVEDNEDLWRKRFDNRFDLFVSAQAVTERLGYDFSPRRTALLSEFAALSLPAFARACLEAPMHVEQIFWGVFQWLVREPVFARYFRDCPESKFFFKTYTEKFLPTIPTFAEMTEDGHLFPPEATLNRVIAWGLISYEICLHVAAPPPTEATLLGLSASTKRALVLKLQPLVLAGENALRARRFRPSVHGKLDIATSSARRMCHWAIGSRTEKGFFDSVSEGGTVLPFIHCASKKMGGCVSLKGGAELMKCGRCHAVRYCSQEHQKADWKAHKNICFEPTW